MSNTAEYQRNYQREYWQKNKEYLKQYHKEWWQKNREFYLKRKRKDGTESTYRRKVLYSVWNNETDEVVIIDGNANECVKAMGVSVKSFYSLVTRTLQGKINKWTFEKVFLKEKGNDR